MGIGHLGESIHNNTETRFMVDFVSFEPTSGRFLTPIGVQVGFT